MNDLFKRLQAIFPAWRQAFASDADVAEAKRQWTIGLIESGITSAETINAGLAMARKSSNPFLPSVGQFVDWCQIAVRNRLNFPSVDAVLIAITRYSHSRKYPPSRLEFAYEIDPISYWIYRHVDTHLLTQVDEREARRMIKIAYDEASEIAARGYAFEPAPTLIAEPQSVPERNPEAAKKTLSEIKSLFGRTQ